MDRFATGSCDIKPIGGTSEFVNLVLLYGCMLCPRGIRLRVFYRGTAEMSAHCCNIASSLPIPVYEIFWQSGVLRISFQRN